MTLPGYHLDNSNYGPTLKGLSIVSGKYVACFDALKPFTIIDSAAAKNRDFGGFVKSPVGNTFSYKFVLFSLLCQLNFLIYGVNNLLVENPPTKLRFSYIMYYYLCNVLPEVNATHDTNFELNRRYQSREFRNAMAHYKLGAYLKPSELIFDDSMFGMTQKGFGLDYCAFEEIIMSELLSLSVQIEKYLKL